MSIINEMVVHLIDGSNVGIYLMDHNQNLRGAVRRLALLISVHLPETT